MEPKKHIESIRKCTTFQNVYNKLINNKVFDNYVLMTYREYHVGTINLICLKYWKNMLTSKIIPKFKYEVPNGTVICVWANFKNCYVLGLYSIMTLGEWFKNIVGPNVFGRPFLMSWDAVLINPFSLSFWQTWGCPRIPRVRLKSDCSFFVWVIKNLND